MGVQLSLGNDAIEQLANDAATAAALYVLIVLFAPVSGAHFNPAVTMAMRLRGDMSTGDALAYVAVQLAGAVAGVLLAHAMFGLGLVQPGLHVRTGAAQWLSEGVATFGLLLAILLGLRHRPQAIPVLVASWIFAAYWFTASTSFANPAVTLARGLTQTFAGIRPVDVPAFVIAQLVGAGLALGAAWLLDPAGDRRLAAGRQER
jgi:glycerol uptake facilitator-like aquaporin